jgi:two-component system, chemotaxis family, protein-glutamate methylesterase/glutaminase
MSSIRTLLVDDSFLTREMIAAILATDSEIEVVGDAGNGREAVRGVLSLSPDIVIMDIDMPVMDGFEAIKEIMALNPVPILVVSSMDDAESAYRAISLGALDVLSKSEVDVEEPRKLTRKVRCLSQVKVISHLRGGSSKKEQTAPSMVPDRGSRPPKIIAIAASTGGPKALSVLIPALPADLPCSIVVAQHIAIGFAAGMVDWLHRISRLDVKVAEDGDSVTEGVVYVSPSEKNMVLNRDRSIALIEPKPDEIYHPSCDALLSSVALRYGASSIGIILTGMGSDGVEGMKSLKAAGGITIAQDEASSVVFGMPKVAIQSNCIDKVLPLDRIAGEIIRLTRNGSGGL